MTRLTILLVLLAGCGVEPTNIDGGGDLAMRPATLCTTSACAQTPCTAGCVYAIGPCTAALPVTVDTAVAEACPEFCGLFPFGSGGCGYYDGLLDGCQTCGFRWGDSSCVMQQSPIIDYQNGAEICSSMYFCFDPRIPVEDGGADCNIDGILRD